MIVFLAIVTLITLAYCMRDAVVTTSYYSKDVEDNRPAELDVSIRHPEWGVRGFSVSFWKFGFNGSFYWKELA
jgi:hypothetical protein